MIGRSIVVREITQDQYQHAVDVVKEHDKKSDDETTVITETNVVTSVVGSGVIGIYSS